MVKGILVNGDRFLTPFFGLSFKMCGQFQNAQLQLTQGELGSLRLPYPGEHLGKVQFPCGPGGVGLAKTPCSGLNCVYA